MPFFICEICYASKLSKQACLDNDYGIGITLRQWLYSSSLIGMWIFLFQLFIILWKVLLPRKRICAFIFTVSNIICSLLKFFGYNFLGCVLYGTIDSDAFSDCSGSVLIYMKVIIIVEIIVVVCLLCYCCTRLWIGKGD